MLCLLFRLMFNLDQAPDFGRLKLYSNQNVCVVVIYDRSNRYIKQSKPVFYYFSNKNIPFITYTIIRTLSLSSGQVIPSEKHPLFKFLLLLYNKERKKCIFYWMIDLSYYTTFRCIFSDVFWRDEMHEHLKICSYILKSLALVDSLGFKCCGFQLTQFNQIVKCLR